MTFSRHDAHSKPLFDQLSISTIDDSVFLQNILLVHKTLRNEKPIAIKDVLSLNYPSSLITTRGKTNGMLTL